MPDTRTNPLLSPWPGPFGGVPPWDAVTPELFPMAFEAAIQAYRDEIAAIAATPEPATFANTIEAKERAGCILDRVLRVFAVMRDNIGTPDYQALGHTWQPRTAAVADEVTFNAALFARVESVYRHRHDMGLAPDQIRLSERVHESFVRQGARLQPHEQQQLSAINQRLAALFSDFHTRMLADENTWITLEHAEDLAGLPESVVAAAAQAAAERGLDGRWAIVNTRSSVDPFLTFSARRDLRERVWRAFKHRGANGDANDTRDLLNDIVRLRADRAILLGYASHAHWRLADSMAKTPEAAYALMMRVWPAAVARVRQEVAAMQTIADRDQASITIAPWDYLFYAEKVRQDRFDVDHSELRPYLALDNLVAAALWSAEVRFDLQFREITGTVPVFHPDVRVWEVLDAPSGHHRGVFYLDNFARPTKRSGAWASTYRTQRTLDGPTTALVSNNNNFVKGAPAQPVLLSLDDATTLFHEFGHSLHSLLQDIRYPGLASTPRDFVEFPSQVNESWLLTRELLDRFARHVDTGEPIPQSLIDRVRRTETFNQGYATVEYLAAAIVDMDLHTRADPPADVAAFEGEVLARIGMPAEIALRHRLPHFSHLFGSDSYSAGYYSYIWSDVMAADAWRAFLDTSPWDRALNQRLRHFILSDGNSSDRAEAYRRFRGRDPEVEALFESRGL